MIEIDREHPDHRRRKPLLQTYRDLYAGGQQFQERASDYLLRRQKEPLDVYGERLQRAFYQNYVGSIIDWYAATLFRRAPSLHYLTSSEGGRRFLTEFSEDCDQAGTNLSTFFRDCFVDVLTVGSAHILVDFPTSAVRPANRAEEEAAGLSRAYLVHQRAENLINWSKDARGEYEWVVLRTSIKRQLAVDSSEVVEETYWAYYDRERFRTFKRVEGTETKTGICPVSEGLHCLSKCKRVPLVTLSVSDGLWLMNKTAHLQMEHFNKSNALAWAITMGLFAMPVIYSDREWNQIVGESYYVQLGPQDRFGWAEPDGKVYQIAASNLESLKEEIYRVCYLAQASGELVGGQAQSAASKQLDFTITKEVLRSYAATVRDCIQRVIKAIVDAREDEVAVSVSGLDEVDLSDFATELQDAKDLLALGIESPTLRTQIYERLATKFLSEARQETKDQIASEIKAQLAK
jgi:hypothetical protein